MGKAQIEELKSQCAANSPWYPATGSVANGIEVVVMASAMSDLFTVSFVAASLALRISVRGRDLASDGDCATGRLCCVDRPLRHSLGNLAASRHRCYHRRRLGRNK